jgi:hypothetical protein
MSFSLCLRAATKHTHTFDGADKLSILIDCLPDRIDDASVRRDDDGFTETVSALTVSVSPGRTGSIQRTSSTPGEPMLDESAMKPSTTMRMIMLQVCQPLAMTPPKIEALAASLST